MEEREKGRERERERESIIGCGSSRSVITWLNDQRSLSVPRYSGTICSVFEMHSRKCVKYMAAKKYRS